MMQADLFTINETAPLAARPADTERHFYRCLAIFAIDSPSRRPQKIQCGCYGETEHMGRVQSDSLIKEHERCACDDRCTSARGPNCECKCGGENHRTNAVVKVIEQTIGIPFVENKHNRAAADAWVFKIQEIRDQIKESPAGKAYKRKEFERAFLSDAEFELYRKACKAFAMVNHAQTLKTWDARYKALDKALKPIQEVKS